MIFLCFNEIQPTSKLTLSFSSKSLLRSCWKLASLLDFSAVMVANDSDKVVNWVFSCLIVSLSLFAEAPSLI